MKVATFNVNSVRARIPVLLEWLAEAKPDVVAVQETKVEDAKFPLAELAESGYHVAYHGQPRYNGVALLSLEPLQEVVCGFQDPEWPDDCRLLRARYGDILLLNTYVPNGTAVGTDKFDYKLRWLRRFRQLCDRLSPSDKVIWLGDINVAPTPDDVFEPEKKLGTVGFHPDEHAALADVVSWGWTDVFRKFTQGPGHYTFWEYVIPNGFRRNLGWRIDHLYASPGIEPSCVACVIDRAPRERERPSDHTPVIAEFA